MDLLRKYTVPFFQAPDAAADPPPVDPAMAAAATEGADPPEPAGDPAPQPGDPAPEPKPPKHGLPPGVINELTGLRGKARELEQRALQAERQAAEAQALAERLSRGDKDAPAAPQRPAPAATDESEIDRRADYKLFLRDVGTMRERGFQQFGRQQFSETINALAAVGADTDAFVSQVIAVDPQNAHALLQTIGQDLERAVSLVGMEPNRRIAELTRMAMAASAAPKTEPKTDAVPVVPAAPAKTVSRAPAPAPAVDPGASKVIDWRSDKATDEQFDAGFKDMMAKRSARR